MTIDNTYSALRAAKTPARLTVSYEKLCSDPDFAITTLLGRLELSSGERPTTLPTGSSLAIGTKDSTIGTSKRVRSATPWSTDDRIDPAGSLHHTALSLGKRAHAP